MIISDAEAVWRYERFQERRLAAADKRTLRRMAVIILEWKDLHLAGLLVNKYGHHMLPSYLARLKELINPPCKKKSKRACKQ